jgi:hypothetical protein
MIPPNHPHHPSIDTIVENKNHQKELSVVNL